MNWAITIPINKAMGGDIYGVKQRRDATMKITFLTVLLFCVLLEVSEEDVLLPSFIAAENLNAQIYVFCQSVVRKLYFRCAMLRPLLCEVCNFAPFATLHNPHHNPLWIFQNQLAITNSTTRANISGWIFRVENLWKSDL